MPPRERGYERPLFESDDDSDAPLAALEHLDRFDGARSGQNIGGFDDSEDDDAEEPLAVLDRIDRDSEDREFPSPRHQPHDTAMSSDDDESSVDDERPLAAVERLRRSLSQESVEDREMPLAALERLERVSASRTATSPEVIEVTDESDDDHQSEPVPRAPGGAAGVRRHLSRESVEDEEMPLAALERLERVSDSRNATSREVIEITDDSDDNLESGPLRRASGGAAGDLESPRDPVPVCAGVPRDDGPPREAPRADVDATVPAGRSQEKGKDKATVRNTRAVGFLPKELGSVADDEDVDNRKYNANTRLRQSYGVEKDDAIPEVSYPGSSHKVPFTYWKRNEDFHERSFPTESSYRQRRYKHEKVAVEKQADIIQRAQMALRYVRSLRMSVIGIIEDPFVQRACEIQGVKIQVTGDEDGDTKGSEAMDTDD
ncbi:unnamed protein product [Peniophora sp. CBMAI 1063]|nr:unnamed protein product [Peniophora sp. CBMAI 1063]